MLSVINVTEVMAVVPSNKLSSLHLKSCTLLHCFLNGIYVSKKIWVDDSVEIKTTAKHNLKHFFFFTISI